MGGGRVDVVGNRPGGSKTSRLGFDVVSCPAGESLFATYLRSESDASGTIAEEGEEGGDGDGEDEEVAGAGAIADEKYCIFLALCL